MMTEMEISKEEFQGEVQRFPRKQDEGEQSSCPTLPFETGRTVRRCRVCGKICSGRTTETQDREVRGERDTPSPRRKRQ